MFFKKYPQNLKYNVTTEDLGRGVGRVFSYWAKSVESGKSYLSTLPKLLYIYIFFEAIIVLKCNDFPRLLKTHFFYLFCKYFAAISVASSVQVSLQFYFQIFYSTAPNKIVIRLTKVPWGYKTISNKKYIQRNNSSKYTPVV